MRMLLIAFSFPPSNVVGAIRVGKLARFLDRQGHQLRVLTTDVVEDRSLPLEIPREWIVYTDYRKPKDRLVRLVRPFRRRAAPPVGADGVVSHPRAGVPRKSLWDSVRRQYYGLVHIPDMRIGWLRTAVPAGRRLIEEWKPDLVFASAPPFTSLLLASRLSRRFNIPWVADFRDLWVDNPYYTEPSWRRPIEAVLERFTMRSAAALVTVSPIWAEQLRRRHGKVAEVIYNGYAEEDFPQPVPQSDQDQRKVLTIRYTGSIYPGFRDPSALFEAIRLLPEALRNRVSVEFIGEASGEVIVLAEMHGVRDRVTVRPGVPYRQALELQMRTDILLLLQWNDKRDEGNLPGKLFEYLYARRPILFIGFEDGIAAQLIRERAAGLVSNAPERIRDQLDAWIEDKHAGRLTELNPSVSRGLSRDAQFSKLEHILAKILNQPPV